MRQMVSAVVISLLLAGCGGAVDDSAERTTTTTTGTDAVTSTTTQAPPANAADSGATASTTTTTSAAVAEESSAEGNAPEPVPTTEGSSVSGQVPEDLIGIIFADVAQRSGSAESDFVVLRADAAIWNDGSLGCPIPGESYTQAIVNGYWVVIEAGGLEYDYRATDRGFFKLCEGGGSPPSNPTG